MVAAAMIATARPVPGRQLMIVLEPIAHPELEAIHIHDALFAIGRTEAPFEAYPPELAADLSRRHARIFCEHGAVYLADLGSKNGTTVNGIAVRQAITKLHSGDVLGLGKALSYRVHLEPAAVQPPRTKLAGLTLTPEQDGGGVQAIVVTEFPFLISKADDTFARYKDSTPEQVNYLSRRHAHIFLKGGQPFIEDLGSTNGTFVGGTRLDEHAVALHDGDVLAFGGRHFVYRLSLQWEAAAPDPTLTRIGVPAAAAAAAPSADADKTTFVVAADSFLNIFCVDSPPAQDAAPDPAAAPAAGAQDDAPAHPHGKAATVLSGLYTALGGKGQLDLRRARRVGAATLALVALLAWSLYRIGGPEREVADLLASGAYAQAAVAAGAGLASDPDNARLKSLGMEALLKANLPEWSASLKARQYRRAAAQVAAMRQQGRRIPELAPLLTELEWIVQLEEFVAARGGAQAPIRDAADAARIRNFLKQWEEQKEAQQRAFETMSSHAPAFRDAYADALSDVRKLALASGQAPHESPNP